MSSFFARRHRDCGAFSLSSRLSLVRSSFRPPTLVFVSPLGVLFSLNRFVFFPPSIPISLFSFPENCLRLTKAAFLFPYSSPIPPFPFKSSVLALVPAPDLGFSPPYNFFPGGGQRGSSKTSPPPPSPPPPPPPPPHKNPPKPKKQPTTTHNPPPPPTTPPNQPPPPQCFRKGPPTW